MQIKYALLIIAMQFEANDYKVCEQGNTFF